MQLRRNRRATERQAEQLEGLIEARRDGLRAVAPAPELREPLDAAARLEQAWRAAPTLDRAAVWASVAPGLATGQQRAATWRIVLSRPLAAAAVAFTILVGSVVFGLAGSTESSSAAILAEVAALRGFSDGAVADELLTAEEMEGMAALVEALTSHVIADPSTLHGLSAEQLDDIEETLGAVEQQLDRYASIMGGPPAPAATPAVEQALAVVRAAPASDSTPATGVAGGTSAASTSPALPAGDGGASAQAVAHRAESPPDGAGGTSAAPSAAQAFVREPRAEGWSEWDGDAVRALAGQQQGDEQERTGESADAADAEQPERTANGDQPEQIDEDRATDPSTQAQAAVRTGQSDQQVPPPVPMAQPSPATQAQTAAQPAPTATPAVAQPSSGVDRPLRYVRSLADAVRKERASRGPAPTPAASASPAVASALGALCASSRNGSEVCASTLASAESVCTGVLDESGLRACRAAVSVATHSCEPLSRGDRRTCRNELDRLVDRAAALVDVGTSGASDEQDGDSSPSTGDEQDGGSSPSAGDDDGADD